MVQWHVLLLEPQIFKLCCLTKKHFYVGLGTGTWFSRRGACELKTMPPIRLLNILGTTSKPLSLRAKLDDMVLKTRWGLIIQDLVCQEKEFQFNLFIDSTGNQ